MNTLSILTQQELKNEIIIFGAGNIARGIVAALRETVGLKNIKLVGCMVSSAKLNENDIDGVPVYSIDELCGKHNEALVLLAVREQYQKEIVDNLTAHGMKNWRRVSLQMCVDILNKCWHDAGGQRVSLFSSHIADGDLTVEEHMMFLNRQLKNDVLNFEVNLANHCNLNCQCCNHFSPLADREFLDLKQYAADLARIDELFGTRIGRLMLLGGEPLLHPQVTEVMKISRKYLPKTTLYFITNGLLLPKMPDEFWATCREQDITIKYTPYPVKFDYAYWENYARERGVGMFPTYEPTPTKTTYRLPLREKGDLDPYKNFAKCYHANQCIVLREGRLYTCPICAWIDLLNKYFGKNFPQLRENSIDIYKAKTAQEVDEFLKTPIPLCRHCNIFGYEYNIPWATSKRAAKEWLE